MNWLAAATEAQQTASASLVPVFDPDMQVVNWVDTNTPTQAAPPALVPVFGPNLEVVNWIPPEAAASTGAPPHGYGDVPTPSGAPPGSQIGRYGDETLTNGGLDALGQPQPTIRGQLSSMPIMGHFDNW